MNRDKIQEVFDRACLTQRQADAFSRIKIEMETFREAAKNMGITHRCVEEHFHKAKNKLSKPWIKKIAEELLHE